MFLLRLIPTVQVFLLGIMKNDTERMAMSGTQSADAMPQIHAIRASRTLHRSMMYRKGNRVTPAKRNHLRSGLHPWALFGEHKLPTRKILSRFREKDGDLDREDMLAIEILMQTIVVTLAVLQQQRSWA